MSTLFDQFFKEFFYSGEFDGIRRKQENGNLVMEVEAPGFNQENIDVEFNKGYVTVKGETEDRKLNKVFYMGNTYKPQGAQMKDGILKLNFEAPKNQLEGQKIAIDQG